MHTVCKKKYSTLPHGLGQNNHPQAPIPYNINQECHNQSSHQDRVQCSSETNLVVLNYGPFFAAGINMAWELSQSDPCNSDMTWWLSRSGWLSITGASDIPVHQNFLLIVAASFLRVSWRPTQDSGLCPKDP